MFLSGLAMHTSLAPVWWFQLLLPPGYVTISPHFTYCVNPQCLRTRPNSSSCHLRLGMNRPRHPLALRIPHWLLYSSLTQGPARVHESYLITPKCFCLCCELHPSQPTHPATSFKCELSQHLLWEAFPDSPLPTSTWCRYSQYCSPLLQALRLYCHQLFASVCPRRLWIWGWEGLVITVFLGASNTGGVMDNSSTTFEEKALRAGWVLTWHFRNQVLST